MRPDLLALVDGVEGGINELRSECLGGGPLDPVERVSADNELAAAAAAVAKVRRLVKVSEGRHAETLASATLLSPAPIHSCECRCGRCEAADAGYFAQRAALAGDETAAQRLGLAVYDTLTAQRDSEEAA